MKSLIPGASTILFLLPTLGASAASAAPMNLTGSTALAVAAVVAQYSPLLSASEKKAFAALFDGNTKISYPKKKLSISAETVMCKIGNVDITARSCEITFKKGKRSLKGREANEVSATFAAAGVTPEGAAGSMIQTISKLSCTLNPSAIKENSGAGADCSLQTDQ